MKSTLPPEDIQASKPNIGIRTELITEPQDILTTDTIMNHLMHIEPKDVTLKFIFDHVRNYAICGVLFFAGFTNLNGKSQTLIVFSFSGGIVLIFAAVALLGLNFIHGIIAFSKIRNIAKTSVVGYIITTFLLLMGAGSLLFSKITQLSY